MPQPVESLAQLIEVLTKAIKTNGEGLSYILLDGALFTQAGTLAGYLGAGPLTITQLPGQPLLTFDAVSVTLAGTSPLFGKATYELRLIGTVPHTTPLLRMSGSPSAGEEWSFSDEFPGLPEYTGNDDGTLVKKPSFFKNTAILKPVFTASTYRDAELHLEEGLRVTGVLDATQGDLKPIGEILPDGNNLPLEGAIVVRPEHAFPIVALTAAVKDLSLPKLGTVAIELGTRDSIETAPDGASIILFRGTITVSGFDPITIEAPLLEGGSIWAFTVSFEEGLTLTSGLSQLSTFVSGYPLIVPPGLDALNWIGLQQLMVGIDVPETLGEAPTLQSLGVTVGTTQKWELPIPGIAIGNLATNWIVLNPLSTERRLNGEVSGTIFLGSGEEAPRINVKVDLPEVNTDDAPPVQISADLDPDFPVKLGPIFQAFTGGAIDLNLDVSQLSMLVTPAERSLYLYCVLDGDWPDKVPAIAFKQLNFYIEYSPNSLSGSVTAAVSIAKCDFAVTAAHRGTGQGWQFSGGLLPGQSIKIVDFFKNLLPDGWPGLPESLRGLEITRFTFFFDTLSGDYKFETAIVWKFELADRNWVVGADFQFARTKVEGVAKYSGQVSGSIAINAFKITVAYEFKVQNTSTLTFRIKYQSLSLTCVLSKNDKKQTILKANLGGVTFGGIVEYLVNLVDPNLGFSLSAPWDVLNQISFDNLTLTVNMTTKEVGVSYKLDKDLGIVYIDTIGLAYVDKAGRKTVDISITGSFFDQEYPETAPLEWDLLNDPPPTPPGKGEELLDLRYLGLGQNVGFRETRDFENVQAVLTAMEADFLKPDAPDQNPLTSPALKNLKFTGDGHWLIGADFTIMSAVSLTVVFNDPVLYGLRVALAGEKVKSFSGLDFQILYKKITDTIGVYHVELTLPDAFRQLQFGAVAVTLPIVVVDIYTNGNFRLDFGFPIGTDFSRSFCVQAGPFIGYGGFYFALLDGSTSERVPRITNGTFSPVIEAGLALSVGLGRTIDKGVLSAGVSITVQAILEGTFGWFNPNDRSSGQALYYWIQGTAGIVGKLYGTVNFYVIQAEVNVTAYASVTLTVEAYKAILVELTIGVEISVSLKILFIRVSFSFAAQLDLSFTIGSDSAAPWIIDSSQVPSRQVRQQMAFLGRTRLSGAKLHRVLTAALAGTAPGTFDWTARAVFPQIQKVALSLVPTLTVALPNSVFATHALASGLDQPKLQIVVPLFAANSVPTEARRASEVRAVTLPEAELAPFNLLAKGMLRWALSSYTRTPGLNVPPPLEYALATDLEEIGKFLGDPARWQNVFSYDTLAALMELNYQLRVSTPFGPTGLMHPDGRLLSSAAEGPEVSATIFPMIPDLEMTFAPDQQTRFWDYNCVTPEYEAALAAYYQQLKVTDSNKPSSPTAAARFRKTPGPAGCAEGESLATFLFRDYFAMVGKGAVQAATDLLKAYPYKATGAGASGMTGPTAPPETLSSIAAEFKGVSFEYHAVRGDTIGKVAARFGVSPIALQHANPAVAGLHHQSSLAAGTTLLLTSAVTPAAIASANADYPLHTGLPTPVEMTVQGVKHQVRIAGAKSESLGSICTQYGILDPASSFTFLDSSVPPANPNAENTNLLEPGASITIPARSFQVLPEDDVPGLVAAFFFVRSIGPAQPVDATWYSDVQFFEQYIRDNSDLSKTSWKVPLVKLQGDGSLLVTGATAYAVQGAPETTLAPDTPPLVAGYFAMMQLAPAPFTEAFKQFQGNVSQSGPPHQYAIKSFPYPVAPGDTFGGVARQFGIPIDTLAQANAKQAGLLQPLSVLALPPIPYGITGGDTLGSIAGRFDLTLDELADSVQHAPGILQPFDFTGKPLTIPDVPGRPTPQLTADLVNFGRFNDISGMVTRFLLHGMRVPLPDSQTGKTFPPDTPLWGLYEMDGQQFPVLEGPTGPVGQLDITFTKGAPSDWICFVDPENPTGPTGCIENMTVKLGEEFFADPPSLTLYPEILAGPGPLPLYRDMPPRYSIEQQIHWQTATTVPLPGPTEGSQAVAGQPSLWIFPQSLAGIALEGPIGPTSTTPQYELVAAPVNDPRGGGIPVAHYAWAGAIDVRIQRAPATHGNAFMPNTYVLLGADQIGRDLLLSAWNYTRQLAPPYGKLYLLFPPSATSDNSRGLASASADPASTFLLKTNLTTVTQSSVLAALSQPSGTYYARLEAIPDFLRLAWEASITGSGGYYLNYATSSGAGLPDTLFADGNEATITLLLLVDPQDRVSQTDLGLYPFNNCAVVGDNIDRAASRLYARLAAPQPSDLIRVATVTAGNAGFYLARTNPDPGSVSPTGPDDQTRNLYNLAGFRIAGNAYFDSSNQGLPAGPADTPVSGVSGPTGPGVWWYQQVLPVSKFGIANSTPSSPALPPTAQNPYAGITGPSGPGPLSRVVIDLAFHDIYGNRTFSPDNVGPVTATVGYTDELIGLSSWPGAAADFLFSPGLATDVQLETQLTSQIARYVPAGSYGFEQSSTAAQADAVRYGQIFYQVQQLDLAFRLQTNLGTASIAPDPLKAPLAAFVSKTKVIADAAASLRQRAYSSVENDKLAVIAEAYNVSIGALLEANAGQLVQPLFLGKVVQPILATAGPMNTLNLLVAGEISTPFPPTCDPDGPSCIDPQGPSLTVAELASNNQTVVLTPGLVLRTATRVTNLPDVTNTMTGVAAALDCVVYDEVTNPDDTAKIIPIGLFQDNLTIAGVVAPDLTIEIDGLKLSTGPAPTFQSVQDSFASLGLSTGDFVRKLESKKGIFAASASIAHATFVVSAVPPLSLAGMPAGSGSIDFLATQNRVVTNFFSTGSSLYIGYCCYAPKPFDTFASLAQKFHGITLGQFGHFNANALLKPGVELLIPNLTFLANSSPVYSPYSPTGNDSLTSISHTFATSVTAIAAINRNLPGIFADGSSITIGSTLYPKPLDSLESMANQFTLPFDTFVDKISGMPGLYRQNGVVIAPLPSVPDAGGGTSPAFADLARIFNVHAQTGAGSSAVPILAANRCLEHFLREGASIAGPTGSTPILVGLHDTLDTVLKTFHDRQKLDLTIDQIAESNASTANLLTVNRAFLLPPSPTRISTSVKPTIPPSGTTCESKIVFPVSVTVEMTRDRGLVAPDFAHTPPVFTNTSTLSPRGWNQDANSLNLAAFARAFESAFASFRLKSAVSKRDALSDPKRSGQLWAVNFGVSGLSRLVVASAAPQFYALAPLSTNLMSGSLRVRTYRSGCGLCESVLKTFDSVDLDNWMFQFLSTIDLFLSAPYSTPAFLSGELAGAPGFAEIPEPRRAAGPVGFVTSSPMAFGETGCTGCTGATSPDGPANFDSIVESKLTIADRLKRDVVPILKGIGATGGYYLDVAKEAFFQQMLVRLADAYSINAVVQYPVAMQSPCLTPIPPAGPTASIPPRVSGKIVPDLYTIPATAGNPATTLAGVAAHYAVSTPFLAETIGNAQGLLRTGAEVQYNLPPAYEVKPTDTLNNVAAFFNVESDPNEPGYWETWTPFIEAIASQSILVAGGNVPVVGIARKVNAGDALSTIADYFGVDAATTGEANQSLPGIFIQGRAIAIPGYPQYFVQPNDTFSKIAAAIGITVSNLARAVATRTDLLLAGETLSLTQSLPDVTLSTTKISLGRVGSPQGPDPALSFLITLKHPRRYKSLFLNLKYVINEMEYEISSVAGEGDYRKSSWLTFLLPIGSGQGADAGVETEMEQVQIPIPLRAYPIPPTVTAQSGSRTPQIVPPPNPDRAVAQGKQWDYRLDCESSNAAQDTDHIQVSFNAFPPGFQASALTRTDLVFRALAEFMDAYPQLSTDLAILPTLQPGQFNRTVAIAIAVQTPSPQTWPTPFQPRLSYSPPASSSPSSSISTAWRRKPPTISSKSCNSASILARAAHQICGPTSSSGA